MAAMPSDQGAATQTPSPLSAGPRPPFGSRRARPGSPPATPGSPWAGTLYLQRAAHAQLSGPQRISVTIAGLEEGSPPPPKDAGGGRRPPPGAGSGAGGGWPLGGLRRRQPQGPLGAAPGARPLRGGAFAEGAGGRGWSYQAGASPGPRSGPCVPVSPGGRAPRPRQPDRRACSTSPPRDPGQTAPWPGGTTSAAGGGAGGEPAPKGRPPRLCRPCGVSHPDGSGPRGTMPVGLMPLWTT